MTTHRFVQVVLACSALLPAQTTLRQAGSERALLMGAAADADEFGQSNRLTIPAYAATLGSHAVNAALRLQDP